MAPCAAMARTTKVALVLALVAVFLTAGLPRFLNRDSSPATSDPEVRFAKVCRAHGGTPVASGDSGAGTAQRRCTVRYGGRVYLMDAITTDGFDDDTAHFQRQGCEEARREHPGERRSFVYHPDTGVCEHRI
jgi:hypothetical protein